MAGGRKANGGKGSRNVTVEILRGIRADLQSGFGAVRLEIERTNERLGRLEKQQTETDVRLATELVAVAQAVGQVRDLLEARLDVRDRVQDHELRLQVIEAKLSG